MRLVAKHAQVGYQTPSQRPGCRNCAYCDEYRSESGVYYSTPSYRCSKHDLEVTSGGICPDHRLQRRQDESQLAFLARQRDLLESLSADLHCPQVGEIRP